MAHTFLMEPGQWLVEGTWLDRNQAPISVRGKTLVAWHQSEWFSLVTKLVFPRSDRDDIILQYRGRLDNNERQYTFLMQHSALGKVEGEGLISPSLIVQRFWVLGDERQRRSGLESFRRFDNNRYYYSSGIMAGHHLNLSSIMEATLERKT
ncbi:MULTISPECIES: hypothetical protein [Oscillatoriales]|nr:hypothetical protein [Limnospira maxima]EKD06204.1 hypothetical protein SPLC1_S541490 [Arthrospira platensis C1]MBD2573137.1 hypothetical protein [Arthrospira platensis FACHB-971]MBD2710256.1 hypothetical protein [Arthrospira platensis FACHB-835]MDC0840457.1 hypothetical protein [Limnoraphis robusta]